MCIKSDFEEIILKLAKYGQREKDLLLLSKLSVPVRGYMWKTDRSCYCQHKVLNKFKFIKEKNQNIFNGKIEFEKEIKMGSTTRDGLRYRLCQEHMDISTRLNFS